VCVVAHTRDARPSLLPRQHAALAIHVRPLEHARAIVVISGPSAAAASALCACWDVAEQPSRHHAQIGPRDMRPAGDTIDHGASGSTRSWRPRITVFKGHGSLRRPCSTQPSARSTQRLTHDHHSMRAYPEAWACRDLDEKHTVPGLVAWISATSSSATVSTSPSNKSS